MDITISKAQNTIIASISGELDHHTCEEFRITLDKVILGDNYRNVILDFTNLTFMDSSGIGAIVGRYKLCKMAEGELLVAGADKQVMRLLELGGLTRIIKVCQDVTSAMALIA